MTAHGTMMLPWRPNDLLIGARYCQVSLAREYLAGRRWPGNTWQVDVGQDHLARNRPPCAGGDGRDHPYMVLTVLFIGLRYSPAEIARARYSRYSQVSIT